LWADPQVRAGRPRPASADHCRLHQAHNSAARRQQLQAAFSRNLNLSASADGHPSSEIAAQGFEDFLLALLDLEENRFGKARIILLWMNLASLQ
jgi:hypothetical protein